MPWAGVAEILRLKNPPDFVGRNEKRHGDANEAGGCPGSEIRRNVQIFSDQKVWRAIDFQLKTFVFGRFFGYGNHGKLFKLSSQETIQQQKCLLRSFCGSMRIDGKM